MSAITRHFLGDDAALLPRAAGWLLAQKTSAQAHAWVVAVPTARAGRRLQELLAQKAGGALADPPRICVIGSVLEAVAPALRDPNPPTEEARRAALTLALAELSTDARASLSRQLTDGAGVGTRWAVAGRLFETLRTLWGGGVRAAALAEESDRHAALAELEARHARRLPRDGDLRRLAQIEAGLTPAAHTRLVVVGCLDMLGVVAMGLRQLADAGLPVDVLLPAHADEADLFDDLGRIRPDRWTPRPLELASGELVVVGDAGGQHEAVLRLLERASPLAPADAALVMCDERETLHLAAQLAESGWPVRPAEGMPLATRDPGAVAVAVLNLWREENHAALRRLAADWPADAGSLRRETQLLEEARVGALDDLRAMPASASASHAWLAQWRILPAPGERLALAAWVERLTSPLIDAFPGIHAPTSPIGQALAEIGARLRALAALPLPPMTAADAARILSVDLAAVRVPDLEAATHAGEAVGFLEALLDEAPVLAVVGAVEGVLPDWRAADPFLPGHIRERLQLPTETSLRARDKALLTLALRPRRARAVIVPRRDAEGNPLQPAQLLLEGLTDADLVARSLHLFGEAGDQAQSGLPVHAPVLAPPPARREGQDAFLPILPPPLPMEAWREHLLTRGVAVTSLKGFLACPARFALTHVHGWRAAEEPPAELGGSSFGNLLHEVLRQFHEAAMANPAWRPRTDALAAWLEASLAAEASRQFGPAPGLAVTLQLENAKRRLQGFAFHQNRLWAEGWQIVSAERKLEMVVPAEGFDIRLHGRVDRMDRHPEQGLRIVDFKTGDDGRGPRETHLDRKGRWLDLQLPTYDRLAHICGMAGDDGQVKTGYFLLDAAVSGWRSADFTEEELHDAYDRTNDILARIARQEFPVGEPPDHADGLDVLLCDRAGDREERLKRAQINSQSLL